MTVLDLRKILIGCKIVYKDRFTNEIIDYAIKSNKKPTLKRISI